MKSIYIPNEIINKILSYRPAHPLVAVLNQEWYLLINIAMHYETGNDEFLLNVVEDRWRYCFSRFDKIKG